MFYPVDSLKRGGRFYLCWVADSWPLRFAKITHKQLWSQDIRQLCEDLMEVMTNESGRRTSRFSLRLSSQLMRGLVRLYERKVSVFLGDLCMMNAHVLKHANKKFVVSVSPVQRPVPHPLALPRPELPQEAPERVEEMIQNSGNVVANIQDITLKEAVVPEIQPPNDNFGEEHPGQALQQLFASTLADQLLPHEGPLIDHTVETLRLPENPLLDPTMETLRLPQDSLVHRTEEPVANTMDTLKLPEERLEDRTMEQMRHPDASVVQHSGLDLEADRSDKSRLSAHVPALQTRMSMVSQHERDSTVHRKSTDAEQKESELEKDTSGLPAVPASPALPVHEPQTTVEVVVEPPPVEEAAQQPAPDVAPAPQPAKPVDITLEELEQEQLIRRRRPRRLAIDKRTILSSAFLRARINNIHVELRCEDSTDDIVDLRVPFDILSRRPSHAGHRLRPSGARALLSLFQRRLATEPRDYRRDEQESDPEPVRRPTRSLQIIPEQPQPQNVLEEVEPQVEQPQLEPPTHVAAEDLTLLNVSTNVPDLNITEQQFNITEMVPNLEVSEPRPIEQPMEIVQEPAVAQPMDVAEQQPMDTSEQRIAAEQEQPVDVSMLPTQVLQPLSQSALTPEAAPKRSSQLERTLKRLRPGGFQSFRSSLLAEIESSAAADKENIPPPGAGQLPPPHLPPARPLSVAAMLQEAGLADVQANRPSAEQPAERQSTRRTVFHAGTGAAVGDGDSEETGLGCLDRTRVSLGDSVHTTDTQLFIRNHWGIEATMVKIVALTKAKVSPITVHGLVARGPVRQAAAKGICAARCFSSVLKLKTHGFIKITKDPETLEIRDITLGPKFAEIS